MPPDEKLIQKLRMKSAKRCVNGICIMYIISFALENLFVIGYRAVLPVLVSALGWIFGAITGSGEVYSRLIAENAMSSGVVTYSVSMLSTCLCLFFPFALYGRYIDGRSFGELAPMDGRLIKGFLGVYAAAQLMASFASAFVSTVGSFIAPDLFSPGSGGNAAGFFANNGFELVVIFLSLCVFTPFVEEFVFRGVIFGTLRRYGTGFAVVASSLVFGFAHGSVGQMAYAFAFGVALALVFEKTGSLKTSVLFHFFNNTLNYLLFVLIPYFADETAANMLAVVYNAVCGVIAVLGLIILFAGKKKDEAENILKESEDVTEKSAVGISGMVTFGMTVLAALFAWMVSLSM